MAHPVCVHPPCDRPARSLGLCDMHYQRKSLGKHLDQGRRSPAERWMQKVDMDGPTPDHDPTLGPCWLWTASTNWAGYGQFSIGYDNTSAHRWGYRFLVGEVPDGMQLDHICHDPETCDRGTACPHRRCVNPSHLRVTTPAENTARSNAITTLAAQRTHCANGHEYTDETTYRAPSTGARQCRICMKAANARARQKAKANGPLAPDDPRHGTPTAYNRYGCRCDACRARNAERNRLAKERKNVG